MSVVVIPAPVADPESWGPNGSFARYVCSQCRCDREPSGTEDVDGAPVREWCEDSGCPCHAETAECDHCFSDIYHSVGDGEDTWVHFRTGRVACSGMRTVATPASEVLFAYNEGDGYDGPDTWAEWWGR